MIEIGNIGSTPIEKVLEIIDTSDNVVAKYAIGEKDSLTKMLMQDHNVSISFNYPTFISFKKGYYLTFNGIKYWLMNDYKAVESNGEYRYDLVFHAKEMLFQDVQYWYDKNNIDQSEYGLTGNASYFLQLAVENINKHYGADFVNQGTVEPTDIKYIQFANNTNVFDALGQVCDTFDCEWMLVGDTINIIEKANFGDAVDFRVGETVLKIDRREGESTFDANRILALGSTLNLTEAYQGGDYMIGAKRLRINPSKGKYIDLKPNLKPTEIKTATVIFDDIYPKRIGNIDEIRPIEYKVDENGKEVTTVQYRFKDNGIIFSDDYLLPNEPLMVVFETGTLAGLHFELYFSKDGYSETDDSQYYEILVNTTYGSQLPNDTLKPEVGNKYVLYNFNIELVSHIYIPEAENELFEYATRWLKDQWIDKGVYECPIMGRYSRDNDVDLEIGQRVDLYSPIFDSGNRESRIMGYVKPLMSKFDAVYTIGDNKAYSSKSNIQQRITKLEATEYAINGVSGSSGDVYIIKQFDNTRPSDFNVYSAKASNAKYFNKQTGDTVQGDTLFQKNVQVQGNTITDVIQNSTFTAGAFGTGFQIKNDANGYSYGELDYLRVRKEMIVSQLTIDEIKSVGGTILLSLASLTASNVIDNGTSYRVYFDNQDGKLLNKFVVGDQAIRQTFNGTNIVRYWRLVTGVGIDYIDLSKTDSEQGSSVPLAGDEIIQLGNRTNAMRQHAILLSAYGSDAPSIKQYSDINSFSLLNKEVTVISPSGNKFKGAFEITSNGTTTVVYKDRGIFANGTQYYKNDRVSWLGSLWVCLEDTNTIPSETATYWRKETSGQGDIDKAVDNIQNEITVVRSDFNSELSVQNDKINAKVSQVDFDNLDNEVTNTKSEVEQLAGSITSTIEKVDNIQIGGVNLCSNTDVSKDGITSAWLGWKGTMEYSKGNYIRVVRNKSTDRDFGIQSPLILGGLKKGKEYTVSFEIGSHWYTGNFTYNFIMSSIGNVSLNRPFSINISTTDLQYKYFTFKADKDYPDARIMIGTLTGDDALGGQGFTIRKFQVEEGNKPTPWSLSPQDYLNGINSKAQTFYQDNEPTTKNVGDIWIKKALVDTNGVVNTDQSKNIYQLQMRWDGSTWQRINWSASKSKIEQTDDQIRQTVEKTGIDQLGQGENLYSVFNQRADEIAIEVSKKTTEEEVKAGIKVTPNGVNVYGNEFKVDSTIIANAIETDSLSVGGGNFQVDENGHITAKGANIQGEFTNISGNGYININKDSNGVTARDINNRDIAKLGFFSGGGGEVRVASNKIYSQSFNDETVLTGAGIYCESYTVSAPSTRRFSVSASSTRSRLEIIMLDLPTSKSGLVKGQLWRDGEFLKIVP